MSAVINVLNEDVERSLEIISYSHPLSLTGILLPVWDKMWDAGDWDVRFLENTQVIGIDKCRDYGRPIVIDKYHIMSNEGFRVRPSLGFIKCECNGVISYNNLEKLAISLFEQGSDVLYLSCNFVSPNLIDAMIPIFCRLCRFAAVKFNGVYISRMDLTVARRIKENMESRGCSVILM